MDTDKMAWRTLDDRQLGEALQKSYSAVVNYCRSIKTEAQDYWKKSSKELIKRVNEICDVADERTNGVNKKEASSAKGLDFHNSDDLMKLEQRLMGTLETWSDSHPSVKENVSRYKRIHNGEDDGKWCCKTQDGEGRFGDNFLADNLPYPNDLQIHSPYGRTEEQQKEADKFGVGILGEWWKRRLF